MFSFSPRTKIESAKVNQNFTDLSTGDADTDANRLQLYRAESMPDFVVSGLVWSQVSGLNGTMTSGVAYIKNGSGYALRATFNSVTSRAFTASKDTYIDADSAGALYYTEVANNATTGMTLAANRKRLCLVITGASAITAVRSLGYDPLGNRYYNTVRGELHTKSTTTTWTANDGSDNTAVILEFRRPLDAMTINSRTVRIQTWIRGNASGVASVYRTAFRFVVGQNWTQIESSGLSVGSTVSYQNITYTVQHTNDTYWFDYDLSSYNATDIVRPQLNRDGAAGADTLASTIEVERVELWYNKDYSKAS